MKQQDKQRRMRRGETCFVGKVQRNLVGKAEMQRFIRIEEGPRGGPQARQKCEQCDEDRCEIAVFLEPLIFVFSQPSVYLALTLLSINLYP